jgi:2-polyprenyl-3-methyl-5-hydroxy-6-metoxy-1,4-benzoquinol methylase
MSIDRDKLTFSGKPKYVLRNATVYQSQSGYTFSKFLDSSHSSSPPLDQEEKSKLIDYLNNQLQSNRKRYEWQINLLLEVLKKQSGRLLDIGCGGGAFLQIAKDAGFDVVGIELEMNRADYSREQVKCEIYKIPIDSDEFLLHNRSKYDAVTLWDVIEHVNFPNRTLHSVYEVLKSGGVLLIDTPAKDSFYHQFGVFSYWLSRGKMPTFLNIMYSEHPFGHKQIFSTTEMQQILSVEGFKVEKVEKFHELSFPYSFYLEKLFKKRLAKLLIPLVEMFFRVIKIKNKMVVVAKKI